MKVIYAFWHISTRLQRSTLLLNEGIPRALKGKKLCLKIPRVLPSIFELLLVFQIWGQSTIGGQYLQNINALIFWFKYLQKINAMPSDFWWKKIQVLPMKIFNPFLKGSKVICQRGKILFFSLEIWGHCIYFLQVLKSEYEGIYILQVLPAKSISWCHLILMKKMPLYSEGNTLGILRRSFFL